MKLHKTVILIASVVSSLAAADTAGSLRMGSAGPAPSVTGTIEVGAGSSYIFRGIREAEENLEANLELSYERFYAGIWTLKPFCRGESNQVDWSVGLRGEPGRRFVWDLGLVYHTFPGFHHGTFGTRRGPEAHAGLSMALTQRLAATAYLYHDWRRKASTAEGRLTWQQPFSTIPALFIGDLFAGNVHSRNLFPEKPLPRWDEDYSYYGFTLRAEYRLFPQVTLTPGVQYSGHRNLRRGNHSANTALPASPCDDCGPHDHHLENDSWWWFLRLTRTF